jgi:hypothetical protein
MKEKHSLWPLVVVVVGVKHEFRILPRALVVSGTS